MFRIDVPGWGIMEAASCKWCHADIVYAEGDEINDVVQELIGEIAYYWRDLKGGQPWDTCCDDAPERHGQHLHEPAQAI